MYEYDEVYWSAHTIKYSINTGTDKASECINDKELNFERSQKRL